MKAGEEVQVIKGLPEIVAALVGEPAADLPQQEDALAAQGYRVLAVAVGSGGELRLAGLLGLSDRPRSDSAQLIAQLADLGIQVKMVTGDTASTALAIAREVGIGQHVCASRELKSDAANVVSRYDIFAGVFPEEKFNLVRSLQWSGHVAGMTGDGVNDAPALKQAEVGIAVASARFLLHPELRGHAVPAGPAALRQRFRHHVHRHRPRGLFSEAGPLADWSAHGCCRAAGPGRAGGVLSGAVPAISY